MDVRQEAERWLAADPDESTRAELRRLLDAGDEAALAARFGARLEFGTAGIRGPLGAGPARMNRLVVRRVTAGLAARLAREAGSRDRGVVVGHDARHGSAAFAEDVARVLAGAGLRVHRLPGLSPTPLVAFSVRHLGAAAGVQITASHNPAADNGYKVYWGDGAQIVAPLDSEISAAIDAAGDPGDVRLAAPGDERVRDVGGEVTAAYLDAALSLPLHPQHRDLRIVYTPLHGVAAAVAGELLARAGFADVTVVAEQAEPDPDFPTVAFPNPEQAGALDLAVAMARHRDADLVLANDPDGDRIAAAVPDGAGGWRVLSGDEIGCLLAEWLLVSGESGPDRVVATTVVSSSLLSRIAAAHAVGYAETLTGFKWLAKAALEAQAAGGRMVLAYEQALGAMCGTVVMDKDGMSAALVLADAAATLKADGRRLDDVGDDLARRHGVHATAGRSLRLEGPQGPERVATVLRRLREDAPRAVEGVAVVAIADHEAGTRTYADGRPAEPLTTPPTPLIGMTLADGSRLQVRPSGTEPLLKLYVEVVEPVAPGEPVAVARGRADRRLAALTEAFVALTG